MSKITKIEEFENGSGKFKEKDGFKIIVENDDGEQRSIIMGIDNYQSCCENWGNVSSDDNFNKFIGAELSNIVEVDKACNSIVLDSTSNLDDGDAVFLNFETDRGTLQFAMYNGHNGFYGHGYTIDFGNGEVKEGGL